MRKSFPFGADNEGEVVREEGEEGLVGGLREGAENGERKRGRVNKITI